MTSHHDIKSSHHSRDHYVAKIIQRPEMGRRERSRANLGQLLHIISTRIQWNGSQTSKIKVKLIQSSK